jgi:cytoskeletal protein CcmA (bactofilin family)
MSILGKKTDDRGSAPLPRGATSEASMSIIGPGMVIVGDVKTDGTVRVEGRIEGTVQAGKAVVIGKGGEVHGDVVTQDAVVGGRVRGTLTAESRLELQPTCDVEGQIRARSQHMRLEEGCRFTGQVEMLDANAREQQRALPPAARGAVPAGHAENSTEPM